MSLSQMVFSIRDYSGEVSSFRLDTDLPADGTAWEARQTQLDAIAVAVKALTIGNLNWYGYNTRQNDELGSPANPFAQRETGVRFFWRETAGEDPAQGNFTIAEPDLTIVAQPETDDVDLTGTVVAAIVAAVEAVWNAALAVDREIYRARIVGRAS